MIVRVRTYLSTELFRSERAQAAMFSWPLGVKTKYDRGTYHVIKCTGPSAQISYCKRRTCARPGNEAIFFFFFFFKKEPNLYSDKETTVCTGG